jgi:hypothetical protein
MKKRLPLSPAGKLIAAGLFIAVAGVLVIFTRLRWTPVFPIIAGLFLITGLFGSGAYVRLFNITNAGDSIGLWIQTIGVVVATFAAIAAIIQNYSVKTT